MDETEKLIEELYGKLKHSLTRYDQSKEKYNNLMAEHRRLYPDNRPAASSSASNDPKKSVIGGMVKFNGQEIERYSLALMAILEYSYYEEEKDV